MGCSEMSVTNCQSMQRKIPEEQRSRLSRGGIQNQYHYFPKGPSLLAEFLLIASADIATSSALAPVTGEVNLMQLLQHSLVQTYRCVE